MTESPAGLLVRAAKLLRDTGADLPNPGFGLALADWLESAAEEAELIGPDYRAVAVARAILGDVTQ